jgi:hypothetical protein
LGKDYPVCRSPEGRRHPPKFNGVQIGELTSWKILAKTMTFARIKPKPTLANMSGDIVVGQVDDELKLLLPGDAKQEDQQCPGRC